MDQSTLFFFSKEMDSLKQQQWLPSVFSNPAAIHILTIRHVIDTLATGDLISMTAKEAIKTKLEGSYLVFHIVHFYAMCSVWNFIVHFYAMCPTLELLSVKLQITLS